MPTGRNGANRVLEVRKETRADALLQIAAGFKDSRPCERKTCVIGYDGSNVFNDQCPNAFGLTGCELVSIDATEGVAQQNGLPKAKMVDEAQQVIEIIAARVSGRLIGVAVATLIRSNHAPFRRQGGCEPREGLALHPMSVQGDERLATATRIETGKSQAVVFEAESLHEPACHLRK
jgi:hypothetical protein